MQMWRKGKKEAMRELKIANMAELKDIIVAKVQNEQLRLCRVLGLGETDMQHL